MTHLVIPENRLNSEQIIECLRLQPELTDQKKLLAEHPYLLAEPLVRKLKQQADEFLRSDIKQSLQWAELILEVSLLSQSQLHRAWGLLARGNALSIGLCEYKEALVIFDEAVEIFHKWHDDIGAARVEIARLWVLANLGRYTDAFASGEWACETLRKHGEWRLLLIAIMNLGSIYGERGEDAKALDLYDQALAQVSFTEVDERSSWVWLQQNRAVSLRNLGRFDEAISASSIAWENFLQLGQHVEAARAQENLAKIYYLQGRYNEALQHLDQAYTIFLADGRQHESLIVELFVSDCLLHLRRFHDVLEKCRQIRELFQDSGVKQLAAQAILNEAIAYSNLGQYANSLASLQEAHAIFQEIGNQVWMAMTQLETAIILQHQHNYRESLALARIVADIFQTHSLVIEQAHAFLVGTQAAIALHEHPQAYWFIEQVINIGQRKNVPTLLYHAYRLSALLTEVQGDLSHALAETEQALQILEQLRGRLMLEYRANFIEDKQGLYEEAVRLCLASQQPERALNYAERAKSRALLDLVAYRLDLHLQAKHAEDQPLVQELLDLRNRRDQLYHRWSGDDTLVGLRNWVSAQDDLTHQQEIVTVEKRITDLWHKLLIRNADYAREASLWQVHTESVQQYLPEDTLLVEYFTIGDELLAFVVSSTEVKALRLPCRLPQIQRLRQLLQVNLNLTPRSKPGQMEKLTLNAQGLLQQLYQLLIAPIASQLTQQRLLIVPHGPLHYLPFHALYDGQNYLLQQYEISYLPGASLLRYCQETPTAAQGSLVYAHSAQGKLPNTLTEAYALATLLDSTALIEDQLNRTQIQAVLAGCRVIHLATHGEFRADNPLFSGLMVGGDWLTTIDIFNLRLQASLVTLSGCQTGRNVIQGGDELAGLMRAFLAAGAASVVLTLWSVEDQSTAYLMQAFYQALIQGSTKASALRAAQRKFIEQTNSDFATPGGFAHPYFWASFFLVGASGIL